MTVAEIIRKNKHLIFFYDVSKSAISITPAKKSIDRKMLRFVGSMKFSTFRNKSPGSEFTWGGSEE